MNIIPSMDLYHQKITRLEKGIFNTRKHYPLDPVALIQSFEKAGAKRVHIVDLEATEKGGAFHQPLILQMAQSVNIPVQVGGGIRTFEDAKKYLNLGIDAVVLGSLAVKDIDGLKSFIQTHPNRVIIALDVKDEIIMTHGWQTSSNLTLWDYIDRLKDLTGFKILITDIQTDGMLQGPNMGLYDKIKNVTSIPVIASGGLTTCKNIQSLTRLGVEEAVLGKAMYEDILPLKEALLCSQNASSRV